MTPYSTWKNNYIFAEMSEDFYFTYTSNKKKHCTLGKRVY